MAFVGFTCYKIALILLNVLYLMVSFVLIAIAAYGKAVATIETFSIMGGIIACGILLLLIAIIGLIGALQHHQVLLFFYMVILFLLFFVQFALACACLALTLEQQKKLLHASWTMSSQDQRDNLQHLFTCCGFEKGSVNESASSGNSCTRLELECCKGNDCSSCNSCWEEVQIPVDKMIKSVGGVSLFFSFTEIIGVWMTLRYRNQKNPYANPHSFL